MLLDPSGGSWGEDAREEGPPVAMAPEATQLFGVLLAVASNFLISVSLNIQKCAHLRLGCQAEQKPCYTSRLWWCGIVLLGLGELGNFTAYGFAPIALVAPLGCVSVIGSAFISVFFLKKTMRTADILGGTLTITGIYLLVTFTPNVPQELTARQVQNYLVSWPFLVYSMLGWFVFKQEEITVELQCSFSKRGDDETMRTNRRLMDRAIYDDLVQSKLVLLGTTCHSGGWTEVDLPQHLNVSSSVVCWCVIELFKILEILIFCILLYFYKRKAVKHIMVLLMMVALLASLTVIAVKAVSSMIALSVKGKMQLTYSVFYIMSVLMATSCAFQIKLCRLLHGQCLSPAGLCAVYAPVVLYTLAHDSDERFLNQAMHLYEATAVVPINFVFFTTSAIISGVIFYREFQSAALLSMFMFLLGCLLSFLGVIIIARNKKEEHLQIPFIDCGHIPGQKLTGKIQPDSHCSCYGTLNKEDDLMKRQS
ncbi:hypothetical protein DV515_00000430 [Chloebia gouldiae]|uniref:Uncharacterized protein n=1 Tax=Chloebia gouldiae TaxID=44316 RepID=A0A3L8T198_CHLGU|nr:hypothetical protein DV515_00000430 [Chloebia gouldiae]